MHTIFSNTVFYHNNMDCGFVIKQQITVHIAFIEQKNSSLSVQLLPFISGHGVAHQVVGIAVIYLSTMS